MQNAAQRKLGKKDFPYRRCTKADFSLYQQLALAEARSAASDKLAKNLTEDC